MQNHFAKFAEPFCPLHQNGQSGRTQETGIVSECRRGKTAVFKNGRAGSGSDVSRNRGKAFAAAGRRGF